jgi:prepilin-type N-terminal cleavage/methylation domain-containing protein
VWRVELRDSNGSSRGFTLFEMVVAICVIAILYMVVERRMNELPAAAERASFLVVLEQIRTGVTLEVVRRMADGLAHELFALEGSNPIDFLLEKPSNYGGELHLVTDAVPRRGAWYYELATGQLVYVVGRASVENVWVDVAGISVHTGQIRMQVVNVYQEATTQQDTTGERENWLGLGLREVQQYRWEQGDEQTLDTDGPDSNGL